MGGSLGGVNPMAKHRPKTAVASGRVRDLASVFREEILKLPTVTASTRSFRVGKKIFVRFTVEPDRVFVEFKLPPDEAKRSARLTFINPMRFGGMGKHGWVEASLTRNSELRRLLPLIRSSRALYGQA
jgi:predicted DNA-binding protein (MmcQ/YjbR family)